MNARNRVFMILGLLTVGSLIWYFATTRRSGDLQLIGTVDANEVVVSSKIPGRIQTLTVEEGQDVKAGQLIAVIESQDLAAALKAAEATAASERSKLNSTVETERQNRGETTSATVSAEAQVKAAQAALAQAQAQYEHQQADTSRAVALAQQGIMSAQTRDEMVTALQAAKAAVDAARRESCRGAGQSAPGARARAADRGLGAARWTRRAPMRRMRARWLRRRKVEEGYARCAVAGERQGGCVGGAAGRSGGRGRRRL